MAMFNRNRKMGLSNVFLLGMTAGVALGSYLANRLMPKEEQQSPAPMQQTPNNSFTNTVESLGMENKKDLFDSFLNGNNEELLNKMDKLN